MSHLWQVLAWTNAPRGTKAARSPMIYELDMERVCSPAHAVAMHGAALALPGFQAVRTRGQAALETAWISDSILQGATMISSRLPGHSCCSGDSFSVSSYYGALLTTLLRNALL
jgi:hypothetical protein